MPLREYIRDFSKFIIPDSYCQGVNSLFADNGLSDVESWLYFPADAAQMIAIVERVFFERGIRFIFSTRAKVPYILKPDGSRFFEGDYKFEPGKDETILEGKAGYVVSFGEMLYRSYDAVLRVREQGLDVGLINKSTLNLVDEEVRIQFLGKSADCLYLYQTIKKIGSSPFVLVVESLNKKTGVSFFFKYSHGNVFDWVFPAWF